MRKRRDVVIAVCVLVAGTLSGAASARCGRAAPPLIREGVTEKISDHVYVIPDASVAMVPNVGIIVGSRATFVIDTGLGARNGQTIVREMAKVSKTPDLYLATTHFHPEHDLGAQGFPAHTQMIRSRDQQADIDEFGLQMAKRFSGLSPLHGELLLGAEFRRADTHIDAEYTVDLGGVRVHLFTMGANHTRGDTAFFIEPDSILFSGDIVMMALPAFASPYSLVANWLRSLDRFEKLQPKRIVPSHGPMGDGSLIGQQRDVLKALQTRARELRE